MENPIINEFDIFDRDGNVFIINNETIVTENHIPCEDYAIFAHFYYRDVFDKYKKVLSQLAVKKINIYITTSNESLYKYINQELIFQNVKISQIRNRGRDVGALLVGDRKRILKYKYICFIHDKGRKPYDQQSDVDVWNATLWENLLGAPSYVSRVLQVFDENSKIGLIVPPSPYIEDRTITYNNLWGKNYSNTLELAEKLNIDKNLLDDTKRPLAISTAFWCKVDALRPLFEYSWDLNDFPEEPTKDDGTITHAIERILPFVAQSEGYDTGIILEHHNAEKLFAKMFYDAVYMTALISDLLNAKSLSIYQMRNYHKLVKDAKEYTKRYEHVYCYGNGKKSKQYREIMTFNGIRIDGIITSDGDENTICADVFFHDIYKKYEGSIGIVICLSKEYSIEVKNKLEKQYGYKDGLYLGLE